MAQKLLLAFQAQPKRTLDSLSAQELLEMMEPNPDDKGGRSVGGGRKSPKTDDRYLYVMAFQERTRGISPEQTLLELLGLARPTETDGTTNPDYARVLSYYQNHPELYREVGLVLRWDEATEKLSVTPATTADLAGLPEPIFDIDEFLEQKP